MMLPNGKTARKTRELDKSRLEEIRKHVLVHVFWECQIDKWLKKDPVMKKKFANYEDEGLNYYFSLLFFIFSFSRAHIIERIIFWRSYRSKLRLLQAESWRTHKLFWLQLIVSKRKLQVSVPNQTSNCACPQPNSQLDLSKRQSIQNGGFESENYTCAQFKIAMSTIEVGKWLTPFVFDVQNVL